MKTYVRLSLALAIVMAGSLQTDAACRMPRQGMPSLATHGCCETERSIVSCMSTCEMTASGGLIELAAVPHTAFSGSDQPTGAVLSASLFPSDSTIEEDASRVFPTPQDPPSADHLQRHRVLRL